jgi:hypothetical protein
MSGYAVACAVAVTSHVYRKSLSYSLRRLKAVQRSAELS